MDTRKIAMIISLSAFVAFFVFVFWLFSTNDQRIESYEKSKRPFTACGETISKSLHSVIFRIDSTTCKYVEKFNEDVITRAKLEEGRPYKIQGDFTNSGCFVNKVLGSCDKALHK